MKSRILFRADGNSDIGLGHVIRSLALAEMLKTEFECVFAIQEPSEVLYKQIGSVCSCIYQLPRNLDSNELFRELDSYILGDEIVVLDGYKFNTGYQKFIKEKGCAVVCIDDIHSYHFVADLIINHGICDPSFYSYEPYTRILFGPKFSLLRKPFLERNRDRTEEASKNNIFLCFGGSDLYNLTTTYLEWILEHKEVDCAHVIVGSAFKHIDALNALIEKNKCKPIFLHQNITAERIVEIIKECKVAIVPGSTVSLECASLGIRIMCGYYVDNQHDIDKMLEHFKLAISVGDFRTLNNERFHRELSKLLAMNPSDSSQTHQMYFDGLASERLLNEFVELSNKVQIKIRKADFQDRDILFQWANDQEVRDNAINSEPINYQNHCKWFEQKLQCNTSFIYLFEILGKEFGQVRFDLIESRFIISYSIAKESRGKGLAKVILRMAIDSLRKDYNKDIYLRALVKKDNIASLRVFQGLKFNDKGQQHIDGNIYEVFENSFSLL